MSVALMQIADALRQHRFRYADELQLHEGIEQVLTEGGFEPLREVRLGSRERIDFLVGAVGIEVKVAGTLDDVARQLKRYAAHDAIEALILVTTRMRHSFRPGASIDGKPLELVQLGGMNL